MENIHHFYSGVLEQLRERARLKRKRVLFPEESDSRVRHAIERIMQGGICHPVVLNGQLEIQNCEVFWLRPDSRDLFEEAVGAYTDLHPEKGMTRDKAREEIKADSLLLSTLLVRIGYVDTGVAGSIASTADMLRACLRGIGLHENSEIVSSILLIDHHHRLMTFGDCAVNPDPDAEQLAQIAIDSANSHRVLTRHEPKVALLSFSTHGSAEHESVEKVRAALAIVKARAPHLKVCGELQADAALVPEIGKKKAPGSDVAGWANVLIFPDLNSGNIACKIAECLGGAQVIGPILQGLDKPWIDLSRGCKSDDIVNAAAIASLLSGNIDFPEAEEYA
ncbi:MAG: phosphate acyltransferase [Gammaproteobacteria bacterium]|nr:phosphate acyltransferase [Gammaproteobacteria bacterium]